MANVTISGTTNTNKVNTSKFMGSAFAAGSALSKRVSNQEKKLTTLKNIVKLQKLNIDELKHKEDGNEGLREELQETNNIIQDIGNALALDFANRIAEQKAANKNLKLQADQNKKASAEEKLESNKRKGLGGFFGKGKVGEKVGGGLKLGGIFEAIKLVGTGIAINALWPKLEKIFEWTIDNFDKILIVAGGIFAGAGLLALAGALGTLIGVLKVLTTPLAVGMLLFTFGKWGTLLFGKSSTDKKVDLMVESIGREETINLLKEQLKDAKWGTGNRANIKEQIKRLETGQEPSYGFWGENKVNINLNDEKKEIENKVNELIQEEKDKWDISYIDLEPKIINGGDKDVNLNDTTEVAYHSSVNDTNSYMFKTPALHGIG